MKIIICILLSATFLLSCAEEIKSDSLDEKSEVGSLSTVDLRNYFWDLDNYSEEKVLVYEIAVGFENIQGYYRFSRVADNKLKITSYDQDFDLRHLVINSYSEEGVTLEKMNIYPTGDSTNEVSCNIIDGNIFPFYNDNTSSINHFTYSTEVYPNAKETAVSDFKELQQLACGDEIRNTIVSQGKLSRFFNEQNEFEYPVEFWYAEGFGLSRLKISYADFDYIETYIETISLEDFNNLRRDPI